MIMHNVNVNDSGWFWCNRLSIKQHVSACKARASGKIGGCGTKCMIYREVFSTEQKPVMNSFDCLQQRIPV